MDKSRLIFRGGVRSFLKRYEDDTEERFYYKARTPNELALHHGAEAALTNDGPGAMARQKLRAKFIAASLCDEAGVPVLTVDEAELITASIKSELVGLITSGSNDVGDAKKD